MKIYKFNSKEKKCVGCGWSLKTLYQIANNEEEARELFEKDQVYCSDCMCELLDRTYKIKGERIYGFHVSGMFLYYDFYLYTFAKSQEDAIKKLSNGNGYSSSVFLRYAY